MSFAKKESYTLTIKISGYNNSKGQFAIALYNNKNQFTDNPWKSFQKSKSTAVDSVVTLKLLHIPKGTYAISFLDDENSNKKMDYAFLGYPKEGFGFSNNAKPGFLSAPKYKACTFEMNTNKELQLKVQYWSK